MEVYKVSLINGEIVSYDKIIYNPDDDVYDDLPIMGYYLIGMEYANQDYVININMTTGFKFHISLKNKLLSLLRNDIIDLINKE